MNDYVTKMEKMFALLRLLSGISGHTIDEIQERTGIPRATFYNYKRELEGFGVTITVRDGYYIYNKNESTFKFEFLSRSQTSELLNKLLKGDSNKVLSFYNMIMEESNKVIPTELSGQIKKDFFTFQSFSK